MEAFVNTLFSFFNGQVEAVNVQISHLIAVVMLFD